MTDVALQGVEVLRHPQHDVVLAHEFPDPIRPPQSPPGEFDHVTIRFADDMLDR